MRLLAVAALAVVVSGCLKGEAPLSAKTVEASSVGYTIEVKTLPGLEVEVSSQRGVADDTGLARVKLSVASLSYAKNMSSTPVRVHGTKGLTKYFGSTYVELPFTPEVAETLPAGDAWLRVLGGGAGGVSGGSLWFFGKEVGGALLAADGSLSLEVLSSPAAKVRLAGHEATANEMGRSELKFTPAEVLALLSFSDDEPVDASVNGKPVALRAHWTLQAAQVRPLVEKPLGGSRASESMALFFNSRGQMSASGRVGKLSTLDVLAVGTAQPERKMPACGGYHLLKPGEKATGEGVKLDRVAIDEEVVARDAHTGQELARKVFTASDFCPSELRPGDSVLKNEVSSDDVNTWLKTL
ncbi:MAG: hypothetical protein U0228_06760 [Myxococcaceae bacterium]